MTDAMDGTCLQTESGHLVLVSPPIDYAMQALLGGTLELGEKYLSLREGDDLTPVFLPPGTTLAPEPGMRLRIGDHVVGIGAEIAGSGGHVEVHGTDVPAGSGLVAGDPVVVMHEAWPAQPSDRTPPIAEAPPRSRKRRRLL